MDHFVDQSRSRSQSLPDTGSDMPPKMEATKKAGAAHLVDTPHSLVTPLMMEDESAHACIAQAMVQLLTLKLTETIYHVVLQGMEQLQKELLDQSQRI